MGKRKHKEGYTFIERLCCYCKLRAECKTRTAQICLYIFTSILLIGLIATCLTIGIKYRANCSYNKLVPYWVCTSAGTPLLLLIFIKAVKEDQVGVTCWRTYSLLGYVVFLAWLITGSIWVYNTWIYVRRTCNSCCEPVLIYTAFVLTFVNWMFFILATIPNVYIIKKMLCCGKNTVKPLKHGVPYA